MKGRDGGWLSGKWAYGTSLSPGEAAARRAWYNALFLCRAAGAEVDLNAGLADRGV
jgi:hypothetical protein